MSDDLKQAVARPGSFLQTVRAVVNGATKRIRVCTRCIRSKKVVKAA